MNTKTKTKTKKNKRRCNYEKTTHTLDVCHEKKLEHFNKDYGGLNKLRKELKSIRKNRQRLLLRHALRLPLQVLNETPGSS